MRMRALYSIRAYIAIASVPRTEPPYLDTMTAKKERQTDSYKYDVDAIETSRWGVLSLLTWRSQSRFRRRLSESSVASIFRRVVRGVIDGAGTGRIGTVTAAVNPAMR